MDHELHSSFFTTLSMASLITFIFLLLFKLFFKASLSSKNSIPKLPPGPPTLPLIGNIHQMIIGSSGSMPHHLLRNLASKYGPLMHLKLGEVSHIVVTSPEIAEQMLKTHDLNFLDRPNLLSTRIMSYNNSDIPFSSYGHYWRQLRKICTTELLTAKRVMSFRCIREEEVSELRNKISTSEGSIFNLSQHIFELTFGILSRAAVGKKSKYQQGLLSAIKEQLKLMGLEGICVADLYPSCSKLLQMLSWGKAKGERLHQRVDRILQDIIDDRRKRNETKAAREEDLLGVLLKLQHENDYGFPFTDDTVKAIIQDMFMGGGDTSSIAVEWAMSELIKNPKVMEEAQIEVRSVFDRKGYVDETELHKLIYLKMVIKETLRLHPPAPLLNPRKSRERCQINGYEIPARSTIIINAWAIGRDPKYWDEAESFKPNRFLDSKVDYRGMDFEFIPFSAGRRICPGIGFATPNMELPLATLLYHFDWKLPNGMKNEELDMTGSFGLTIRRQNDLCLIPIIRRS